MSVEASLSACAGSKSQGGRTVGLTDPLARILNELAAVVAGLSVEQFTQTHGHSFGGTIGGHIRHSLDHVTALLEALDTGRADYDRRERGTAIETNPAAALAGLRAAALRLTKLADAVFDRSVEVCTAMTAEGPSLTLHSHARRELAFVLSHTVHHNAMIGAMVRALGGTTPPRFGYAPSTVAHLQQQQQQQ